MSVIRPLPSIPSRVLVLAWWASAASAQTGTWSPMSFTASPGLRSSATMAFDSGRSVLVLFGGNDVNNADLNDTWELNGSTWTLRNNSNPRPPAGGSAAMVFDPQRGRTVLLARNTPVMETWEWDGTTWTLRTTSGPVGRSNFAVAYDSTRGRTVLFGGQYATNLSDTWEWDGTSWLQRSTGGPPGRYGHAMCFDSARGVVVLQGGRADSPNVVFGDTWEWNGIWWQEHFAVGGPTPRAFHRLAFDAAAGRSVLFGGENTSVSNETWEWDGSQWALRSPPSRPSARARAAMAYDPQRQEVVLYGGLGSGGALGDGWLYAILPAVTASFTQFGTGCAGPTGVPVLAANGTSLPRLGTTFSMRLSSLPSSPFNLPFGVLGTDNTVWNGQPLPLSLDPLGFTGCQAWLAPEITYVLTNGAGSATWNITVPFAPSLLNLQFFAQGAVLVPGWNPGGLVFSNAGRGVVGIP